MNKLFALVARQFQGYSLTQRVLIVLLFVCLVSAIIAMVFWANRPEYVLLYADLAPSNASQIVSELRDKNVKYKIENNGTTIKVPAEQVEELRLEFVEAGYVGDPIKGYKVFDDSKIGMTTFMQQLNLKRALEGELAKTINKFPEITSSRVHLVLPKNELFEDRAGGKASVVLYLKQGQYLGDSQVRGIAALVANSVEGIDASSVVIVDSKGSLLSTGKDEDAVYTSAGNQWELRHQVEQKLENKVAKIVENVVGRENAVVEVSAELNFEKLEKTTEKIDPENLAVISEERQLDSRLNLDTLNNINEKHTQENIITNYETNKSVEHFVRNTGNIKRLSVAVLVNGKYEKGTDDNGKTADIYQPRSRQELDLISQLVKSAVGYDDTRGDLVEVKNLRFDRSYLQSDQEFFQKEQRRQLMTELLNKGLIIIGIAIAFLLLKKLFKHSSAALKLIPQPKPQPALQTAGKVSYIAAAKKEERPPPEEEEEIPEDIFIKKLSPEARAKLKAKRKMLNEVSSFVKEKPEDAAQMIKAWITER